jgi:hypothetical protein
MFDMRTPDVRFAAGFGRLALVYSLSLLGESESASGLNELVVHANPGISSSKRGRWRVGIPTGGTRAVSRRLSG